MHLPHLAALERCRHRLKEVLHAAADTVLERTLKFLHIDVQADLRAIACIPRFLGGEQRDLRIECIARRELLIARTALPERTQSLGEDLVV